MKRAFLAFLLAGLLAGCSSEPAQVTEPTGETKVVKTKDGDVVAGDQQLELNPLYFEDANKKKPATKPAGK